ncbi:hypothetical protein [Sulfurivermis fontis]|uniref:hypothetical protein n=1 Tax=Sulfurivermis fontis TaxID=1972068 RepID=UPI001E31B9AA|nr:hypothetical protein [Sulfurivermis fontis]
MKFLQQRRLIVDRHIQCVDEYDVATLARIVAAAGDMYAMQRLRRDAKSLQDGVAEIILGVFEREPDFGES